MLCLQPAAHLAHRGRRGHAERRDQDDAGRWGAVWHSARWGQQASAWRRVCLIAGRWHLHKLTRLELLHSAACALAVHCCIWGQAVWCSLCSPCRRCYLCAVRSVLPEIWNATICALACAQKDCTGLCEL